MERLCLSRLRALQVVIHDVHYKCRSGDNQEHGGQQHAAQSATAIVQPSVLLRISPLTSLISKHQFRDHAQAVLGM